MKSLRMPHAGWAPMGVLLGMVALCLAPGRGLLYAQTAPAGADAAAALTDALLAACRQNVEAFATHLTTENAVAFRGLPLLRRTTLLKRVVLLENPGTALLSSDGMGHTVVRCEAGGVVSEMRFGASQVRDNLAFIPVEVPRAGQEAQTARFGLVREDGQWKLLSLGLLLLDVPALALQWEQAELEARDDQAAQSLRKIAEALRNYQQAYGRMPETLAQLGPSGPDGHSPEKAGFLDASLAAGEDRGYRFRYNIVPAGGEAPASDRNKLASFQLAATPIEYGKDGLKSLYLDASGILRGGDKQGAVATSSDPRINDPRIGGAQP